MMHYFNINGYSRGEEKKFTSLGAILEGTVQLL